MIADFLMASGTIGAAIYCYILSHRLSKLTNLESGVGGAVSGLSARVDAMNKALDKAHNAAKGSETRLEEKTLKAENVVKRLELLVASLHDLPLPEETELHSPKATNPKSPAASMFTRHRRGNGRVN